MPRETKGSNHDNVLSKMYKSMNVVEISVTYFGGGPMERFQVDGDFGTHRLEHRPADHPRRLHRVLPHPGGLRRGEPHHADACAQTTFS